MNSYIGLMGVIAILIVVLALVKYFYCKKNPCKTDYKNFYTIGLIWMIIGVPLYFSSDNISFFAIGVVFLAVGLANKDKWGKDTKTSSPEFTKRYLIALVIGTAVLVLLTGLFLFVEDKQVNTFTNVATSFDDCLEKGNPAMESYPRQCRDAAGNSFTEDIRNEFLMMNDIRSDSPRPGATVLSPLKISGEAVGFWFFEGDFSVELFDDSGVELGSAIATAKGEWMTEDFVPFEAEIDFESFETRTGKLVFKKDNPSGLAENDAELVVPVKFD
jgi:hypothetical protein